MKRLSSVKKGSFKWGVLIGLIVIIITCVFLITKKDRVLDRIQKNYANKPRQAVFLVNGQVYFGKIEKENDRYLVLREIYYLKTQDQLNQNNPDKKVSIIKLGDEVHSPEDRMYISRDQILFYEQMRKESKINEAINKYLAEKK
jgi:alpha-D-ribose 1-methylphosphonate 5-triphosphate diphosphatase PhnM